MLFLLQLLLPLTSALSPGDSLPSCLHAGTTWDQAGIYDLAFHLASPEACQQLCTEDPACLGFTWLTAEAQLLALSCSLFEETKAEVVCSDCVSGPGERCGCSQQGECQIQEGNLIESRDGVPTAGDCEQICITTEGCNFYTYLGEGSHFRHTCFLFSSCDAFIAECEDCTTGLPECSICSFEHTLPNGLCKEPCKDGWSSFENACYKIVDDFNYDFDDIVTCRSLCQSCGGNLASIHSQQENAFVHSLLRPDNKSSYGLNPTWLGAELIFDAAVMGDYRYIWEDSSPWDYTNWWTDEPDMNPSFACVSIGVNPSSPDEWTDGSCHSSYSTYDCLCKISDGSSSPTTSTTISTTSTHASAPPTTTPTTATTSTTTNTTTKPSTTTTAPAPCGDGWSRFNNSCYTILNSHGNHYFDIKSCRRHCSEMSGMLGSVHSQEENYFICQLLRPARSAYGGQATWLGGLAGGEWEDGTPWDFTDWYPGQPDDGQSACVIMGWNDKFPESWDDGACEWTGSIFDCLCKRDI